MASSGKVRESYEKFIHKNFIHHNAYFKRDRESLLRAMEENVKQFPEKKCEILRTVEEKDFVTVHSKITLSPDKIFSVIHIFRFENDKIVEEWEASQELLKDSPNENGIF
jgi:predicted SnoaL-like aldol condensation-catalyzing enzyme